MRASSYNIYVELPDNEEEMLLVHGYTGAYDKVSKKVGGYVHKLNSYELPKPMFGKWSDEQLGKVSFIPDITGYTPSDETIKILKKRGYITDLDPDVEQNTFSKVANTLHIRNRRPSYIIMPTYNCNLRCNYCFQDHMRTDPAFRHLLRAMSIEMADQVLAAMNNIERTRGWNEEEAPQRRIGFFGGEPLLRINKNVIGHIINKAKSEGDASFYAVSNGTELNSYQDLLGAGKIDYLQITLDGPPEEHDKRRIYPNGKGSFEIIAQNVTMALDLGAQVSLRMNIDRNNVSTLPTLAEEFITRGWDKYENFGSYAAPIHKANSNVDKGDTFNSYELNKAVEELRESYESMNIIGRPDEPLLEHARRIFHNSETPSLRSTFCGAHNEMFIFDAFGDIYACWEITGDKKVRIGHINEEGEMNTEDELYNMWRSRNVTTNPTCLKCRYALHCGGGCAVFANQQNGTVFSNYCDAFGKRFNSIVAEAFVEYTSGMEYVDAGGRVCDL